MQFEQLGPYRLGRKLGQGGMGAVYEGVDVDTGAAAAIKVLSPALAAEEGFRVRFEAEIESLKKLRHPHIVRLYGYGEQDGTLFYAMELVRGTSLEDELRAGRRFQWREVVEIAIKLCRALKHAHDHGVIHRDLKPANLLLTESGDIKLSDFGIARLFGNTRLTTDGGVLGTAEYMAPEQVDGRTITDRCDQYSLGGVLYALLAGRPPFRATTLMEMLQLQRFAEPPPLRRFAPDTPAELEQIVQQLLEKDPQYRFPNALLLARMLEAMQRGLSISMSRANAVDDASETIPDVEGQIDPEAATIVPPDDAAGELEAEDLDFEVRRTEATVIYTDPSAQPTTGPMAAPPPAARRFTKVEEERDKTPWYHDTLRVLAAGQTWALIAALAVVAGIAWYAFRPPSANRLYHDVETARAAKDIDSLDDLDTAVSTFLDRYPDDPRSAEVRQLQQQVMLGRAVERAYREGFRQIRLNPETARAKFQALIDMTNDEAASPEITQRFVALAKRQLKMLHRQANENARDDLKLIENRLQQAAALQASNPAAARKIWHAIVELYGDKPWAMEAVRTAKKALATSGQPEATSPPAASEAGP